MSVVYTGTLSERCGGTAPPISHPISLSALAEGFHITYAAHNALAGAETCGLIISLCAEKALANAGKKHFAALTDMLRAADMEMKSL
jgi:hypothetical protein